MRVIISGDRKWRDPKPIYDVMASLVKSRLDEVTFVHGDAKGADTICDVIARLNDWNVEPYPADWNQFKKAAGPIRNKQMLDTDPDMVIGFHEDIEHSKGTKDMLTIAKNKDGVQVFIYDAKEQFGVLGLRPF